MKPMLENVQDLLAPKIIIRKNELIHPHPPQRIQVIHKIIHVRIEVEVERVDIEVEVGKGTDIVQMNMVEVQQSIRIRKKDIKRRKSISMHTKNKLSNI